MYLCHQSCIFPASDAAISGDWDCAGINFSSVRVLKTLTCSCRSKNSPQKPEQTNQLECRTSVILWIETPDFGAVRFRALETEFVPWLRPNVHLTF